MDIVTLAEAQRLTIARPRRTAGIGTYFSFHTNFSNTQILRPVEPAGPDH